MYFCRLFSRRSVNVLLEIVPKGMSMYFHRLFPKECQCTFTCCSLRNVKVFRLVVPQGVSMYFYRLFLKEECQCIFAGCSLRRSVNVFLQVVP